MFGSRLLCFLVMRQLHHEEHTQHIERDEPLLKSTTIMSYHEFSSALATEAKHEGSGIRRTKLHR